jgi:uncharacterized protein YbbK (DUF523 family)
LINEYSIYDHRGKLLKQVDELALAMYLAMNHSAGCGMNCVYVFTPTGQEIVITPRMPSSMFKRAPHAIESIGHLIESHVARQDD